MEKIKEYLKNFYNESKEIEIFESMNFTKYAAPIVKNILKEFSQNIKTGHTLGMISFKYDAPTSAIATKNCKNLITEIENILNIPIKMSDPDRPDPIIFSKNLRFGVLLEFRVTPENHAKIMERATSAFEEIEIRKDQEKNSVRVSMKPKTL